MKEAIFEDRGYFWWHGTPVPDRHFAPEDAVTGLLKIAEDGRVNLELDGFLPNAAHPLEQLTDQNMTVSADLCIQGRLKGSNDNVLLTGLFRNGCRVASSGASYENYLALGCLVGPGQFPGKIAPENFKVLKVHLDGLEEWVRLGAIEYKKDRLITVRYAAPKDLKYALEDGQLRMVFDVSAPFASQRRMSEIAFKERASLVYCPRRSVPLAEMKRQFCFIEDLLILLSGTEYCLDFPLVSFGSKKKSYRFYFLRHRSGASAPAFHECWTNFVQLREHFGDIFNAWRVKREIYGAGFYLYLGTRRGMKLYPEHRFVNLIWGIESLHRGQEVAPAEPSKLANKIERILSRIEDAGDKKWLGRQLRNANEPSLEDRIFDTFKSLPLHFTNTCLRDFAKTCAGMRNDISHYGGQRESGDYADFLKRLERHSNALSNLYALRILCEIGVDPKILEWWIFQGFKSYSIKKEFAEVGLLLKSELKQAIQPEKPSPT